MLSAPNEWMSSSDRLVLNEPSSSSWCSSSKIDSWLRAAEAGAARLRQRAPASSARRRVLITPERTPDRGRSCDPASRKGALGDSLVALGDLGPVHGVEPGVDVVGPLVLILQVVRVLPHVDADQRRLALGDRVVLVGAADDGEAGAVVHEPGPARAELVDPGLLHLRLE